MKYATLAAMLAFSLLFFAFSASSADIKTASIDMQQYPDIFINNGRLDATIIVGEFADQGDAHAAAEIASSLLSRLQDKMMSDNATTPFEIDIQGNPTDEFRQLYLDVLQKKKSSSGAMLDTAFNRSSIIDKNLILVGGPCVNWISAYFMDYPSECSFSFLPGRGYFKLFENGKGTVLMVAGYSVDDTLMAAKIISHYEDYQSNLVGTNVRVSSALIDRIQID